MIFFITLFPLSFLNKFDQLTLQQRKKTKQKT